MKENSLLTGIVMVVIFAAGIFLGYYFGINTAPVADEEEAEVVNDGSVTAAVPAEGVAVDAAQLSAGQLQFLETLGVDTNNLTITPEMVACAEEKVGSARLIEIQNGDNPSISEGTSLMSCL